jgi:hypothetical protein
MRARKLKLASVGLLVLASSLIVVQSLSIYYRSWQFDDYLKRQIWRTRGVQTFKQALLNEAHAYSLPIRDEDVRIMSNGPVFRVDVDYALPLNMLVYKTELKFHTVGAGLVRREGSVQ